MSNSHVLFAQPSFLSGLLRTFELWAPQTVYNESGSPPEADVSALLADWRAVRADFDARVGELAGQHADLVFEMARAALASSQDADLRANIIDLLAEAGYGPSFLDASEPAQAAAGGKREAAERLAKRASTSGT